MAEPIRRRIVEILASGEHSAGDVADVIGREFSVSREAVSKHLAILRRERWVIVRPEWSNRLYRLDIHALESLDHELRWLRHLWIRRIGTMVRNDPMPSHAHPFQTRKYQRGETGERRGQRGKGCKEDPWSSAEQRQEEICIQSHTCNSECERKSLSEGGSVYNSCVERGRGLHESE